MFGTFREESNNQLQQAVENLKQLDEKAQLEEMYIQQELNKLENNLMQPLMDKIDEILFSDQITDEAKLQKAYQIVRQIVPSVKDYIENYTGLSHTPNISSEEIAANRIAFLQMKILVKLFHFRYEILHKEKEKQLKDLFANKDLERNRKMPQSISNIEEDVRYIFNDLERIFFPSDKDRYVEFRAEEDLQKEIKKMEDALYETANALIDEDLEAALSALESNADPLNSIVDTSVHLTEEMSVDPILDEHSPSIYYEETIENVILDILQAGMKEKI